MYLDVMQTYSIQIGARIQVVDSRIYESVFWEDEGKMLLFV